MSYGNGACRKWPRKRQASAYGTRGDSHHIAATPASAYSSVSAWASAIGRDDDCAVTGPIQARIASRVPGASGTSPSPRSEEHTSELQSLMRISYAVFCLKKKNTRNMYNFRQTR